MGCGHLFCLDCWKPYLSLKIGEGPLCVATTCPAHGCNEAVTDAIFKKLTSASDFTRYSRYVLRSYVDINKCVKWCPSPGCNKAISSAGGLSAVTCTCGCVFCLRCGEESHAPVTCEQLASWQEKCKNESETANWILANTKKCPKCAVRIEKNQGCNHMTCKKCNNEFCWICMESWAKHGSGTGGYYKCNRYDGGEAAGDTDAARAKAELDRYLHYYQRFANHSEAGKFAQRMREGTESRMVELQASHGDSSWIDVQFLNAATEQLIECRRVLKYTYVFGYYLPAGKEKNLFEYLQENLEKNAEHLTGLSEAPLDKMNRSDVINYTRVTETFLRNLLTGVEDGLTSAGAL
jgi:ariadne-1